jgi:DNA polymerase III epsilon subunit-like protein
MPFEQICLSPQCSFPSTEEGKELTIEEQSTRMRLAVEEGLGLSLLFFDTETTGVPRNYKAPASDLKNWPRLVQIAWLLADDDGGEIESAEYIVKPEGFTIPAEATRIHGISTEMAIRDGLDIKSVLAEALMCLGKVSQLVGHNIDFDEKILGAELLRAGHPNCVETKQRLCTMRSATDYCRLPGPYGYKWPKLEELHRKLFNQPLDGAHRALVDVRACAKCYFELRRLKVM